MVVMIYCDKHLGKGYQESSDESGNLYPIARRTMQFSVTLGILTVVQGLQ